MSFAENEWMITLVALDLGNSQLQSRHQISMVWNKQLEKTQLTQLTAKKDYPSFLRRKYFGTVLEGIADGLIQTDFTRIQGGILNPNLKFETIQIILQIIFIF